MQKISSEHYIRKFVRDTDHNLYLLHFFAPRHTRQDILALMALHCELRLIPQKVQDPTMMLIRLQWWQDEIDKDDQSTSPILCNLPKLNYKHYFNRVEKSLRGDNIDVDESFYKLMSSVIENKGKQNQFIKKIILHDELNENTKFRAFRLWLGK